MPRPLTLTAFAALSLAMASAVHADVPNVLMTHQGRLLDEHDQPVTGTVQMGFSFFARETPPGPNEAPETPLWKETYAVTLSSGDYSTLLGNTFNGAKKALPANVFGGLTGAWLHVSVEGVELSPRTYVGTVPFALNAALAQGLDPAGCRGCVVASMLGDGAVGGSQLAKAAVSPDRLAAKGHNSGFDVDQVDGFHASTTPSPNVLLALDAKGHLPIAAFPAGPGGGLDADTLDGFDSSAFAPAAIGGTVDRIDTTTGSIKTDLASATVDLTAVGQAVAALKTDVGGVNTAVGGVKTDVGSARSDVAGVKSDVASLKSDVAALKAVLDAIAARVIPSVTCPSDMVAVGTGASRFCVDKSARAGLAYDAAVQTCVAAGRQVCAEDQWGAAVGVSGFSVSCGSAWEWTSTSDYASSAGYLKILRGGNPNCRVKSWAWSGQHANSPDQTEPFRCCL